MRPRRRAIPPSVRAGLVMALGCATAGCVPLAPLALLSSLLPGSGGSAPLIGTGPLSAAPSSVQNGLPADTSIEKALAMDQTVNAVCERELPAPQPPLPEEGCVTRPTCLPGADHPTPLRICAQGMPHTNGALAAAPPPDAPRWRWDAVD
jgi:hypothetical protein